MERFHMIRDMKKKMMGTCGSKSTLPGVWNFWEAEKFLIS
jgi:hypothetical protein